MPADELVPSAGDTAWLLVSSALVLLMTPGLAFFYGGLGRSKSVLNMMMMSFASIGLISILWLGYGFTAAFGSDQPIGAIPGVFGDLGQYPGTKILVAEMAFPPFPQTPIPTYAIMAFQMMFAIITVALISGAVADRARFAGWLLFAGAWFTLAYLPIAHMVWGGGFIGAHIGALDFAGGTAVHINAGAAALALVIVLGRRAGWPTDGFRPHNVPLVALGAGLLWFGWFGFNAGSQLTADATTAIVFVNTQVATAAALLGWVAVEWLRNGKPTLVGASSGAVAGLVAITPACAYLAPYGAVLLGLVAGSACAFAVAWKYRLGLDDSLDVVGIHFVGGWIGCLWVGLFGTAALGGSSVDGLLYGGGPGQLWRQAAGAAIVSIWSFAVALGVGYLVRVTIGFRVAAQAETEGIDIAEHKESAYDLVPAGGGGFALAGLAATGAGPAVGAGPASESPAVGAGPASESPAVGAGPASESPATRPRPAQPVSTG